MNSQLHLHLESMEHGSVLLEGRLPGTLLDLGDDPTVRNVGDISYKLTAERKSHEILVRGTVEAPMELECSRSGLFFSTIVQESAFLRDYSNSDLKGHINLTEDIREAVIINIPAYPVSPEARSKDFVLPGISTDEDPDPAPSAWSALDDLNLP
ncbi:MAG: hypothetical protein JJU29_04530 [Verrucomicrobia bacterium]|nr:hypothetical protein [Verrucomicrobiota bacterium]MCH8510196.1 hypothetical protein [Kiritimatiellia bacterium]